MADETLREAALAQGRFTAGAGEEAGVRVEERAHIGKINLWGAPSDTAFMAAAGKALEMVLPTGPNRSARRGDVTALWLGPDEWLLICPPGEEAALACSLSEALGCAHAAVTDVTDARTVIRLTGNKARDLLAKGCSLDLHPRVFPTGAVAQSLLAKADVILHRIEPLEGEDGPVFDVYVARSFADYLWGWLEDAVQEYGPS